MKTYTGTNTLGTDSLVLVTTGEGDDEKVDQLEHHVHHSPTGFSWGYGGSGPAELARCILWDHLGREPHPGLYQDFKFQIVAQWPWPGTWTLRDIELDAWLRAWRQSEHGRQVMQREADDDFWNLVIAEADREAEA